MTGLTPEQIATVMNTDQNSQQMRNQSSEAISNAMYKQALQQYYQTQGVNEAEKNRIASEYNRQKIALEAERQIYQNLGDLAKVAEIDQNIRMLDAGTHPTQTGTRAAQISANAAAQNAVTNRLSQEDLSAYRNSDLVIKELDRQIGAANAMTNRMNAETNITAEERKGQEFEFNQAIENSKLVLNDLRTRAYAMAEQNRMETDQTLKLKRQAEINQINQKLRSTIADTVANIAESKSDETMAKGYIDLYNDIAPNNTTDLYIWNTNWKNRGKPTSIINNDEKLPDGKPNPNYGKPITLGQIRQWAEEEGVSVTSIINDLAGGE